MIKPPTKIYVGPSKVSGIGVFASSNIKSGEVIEEAPILEMPEEQTEDLMKTELLNYFFGSGNNFENPAIILGYGSLYNHSYNPNARFVKNTGEKVLRFVALKDIKQDEEILVNYNGDPKDKRQLWFFD